MQPCVVMLPRGILTGLVTMLSLTTGRLARRDQFRILPKFQYVISRMNEIVVADCHILDEEPESAQSSGINTIPSAAASSFILVILYWNVCKIQN